MPKKQELVICKNFEELNNESLSKIKSQIQSHSKRKNVYFKDHLIDNKREVCFRSIPYSKSEVDPFTTEPTIIGFRKLGIKTIGIGKLK